MRWARKALSILLVLTLLLTSEITALGNAWAKQVGDKPVKDSIVPIIQKNETRQQQKYAASAANKSKQKISGTSSVQPRERKPEIEKPEPDRKAKPQAVKQLLIKYKDPGKAESIKGKVKSRLKLSKLEAKKKLPRSKIELVELGEKDNIDEVIADLKKDKEVQYVQPDYLLYLSDNQTSPTGINTVQEIDEQVTSSGITVLRPANGQTSPSGIEVIQPAKEQTDIPSVVNAVYGEDTAGRGVGVTVGVLDTGIDISHEDLKDNIYINLAEIPGNGIDDDGNGYIDDVNGWDFFNNDKTVYDGSGLDAHGTHVAGIIAAMDNDTGITGVAPGAKILPLKFINGNYGYTSDAIEAIEYARAMGVRIINCSWGGTEYNPALKDAIDSSGMLFVCAAGNSGVNIDVGPVYPAAFDSENILTVASVDRDGTLSGFSNYGPVSVDVAAPGENVTSTLPGGTYGQMSGTSMAAPYVSGGAALIARIDTSISDIKAKIAELTDKLPQLSGKIGSGGTVNVNNVLSGQRSKDSIVNTFGIDSFTKLLLSMDGTEGNRAFTEATGKVVSVGGNAYITTGSSKFGGSSGYFDGNSYLSLADNEDWNFGSDNFTIDFWVKFNRVPTKVERIIGQRDVYCGINSDFGITIIREHDGRIGFYLGHGSSHSEVVSNGYINDTTSFHHIAAVRHGTNMTIFIDGVNNGSISIGTIASNNSTRQLGIGREGEYTQDYLNGYLDEFRISKGIARWTSNFTPPAEAYNNLPATIPTVPSNISAVTTSNSVFLKWSPVDGANGYDIEIDGIILDCGSGTSYLHDGLNSGIQHRYRVRAKNNVGTGGWSQYINVCTDNPDQYTKLVLHMDGANASKSFVEITGKTVSVGGNAHITTQTSKFGGSSGYFDGSSYLSLADSEDWNFGSDNFTIDFWVKFNRVPTKVERIIGQRDVYCGINSDFGITIIRERDGRIGFYMGHGSSHSEVVSNSYINDTTSFHHIAAARDGTNMTIFIDGVNNGSISIGTIASNNSTRQLGIGREGEYTQDYLNGYLDEFRISKGIARWTSNFMPPSAGNISFDVVTPDLQITDITTTPSTPVTGDAVTFTATVKNNGATATPAGAVHDVDFFVDGTKVAWSDNYTSSIAPGQSVTITANAGTNGAAWTATEGSHTLSATVNGTGTIQESDSSNNTFGKQIVVAPSGSLAADEEYLHNLISESKAAVTTDALGDHVTLNGITKTYDSSNSGFINGKRVVNASNFALSFTPLSTLQYYYGIIALIDPDVGIASAGVASTSSVTLKSAAYHESSENVKSIQKALVKAGYWINPDGSSSNQTPTGYFGEVTRASLIKFQKEKMGLSDSEIYYSNGEYVGCGPRTVTALTPYIDDNSGVTATINNPSGTNCNIGNAGLYGTGIYGDVYDIVNALNGTLEWQDSEHRHAHVWLYSSTLGDYKCLDYDLRNAGEGETVNVEVHNGSFNNPVVGYEYGVLRNWRIVAGVRKLAEIAGATIESDTNRGIVVNAQGTGEDEVDVPIDKKIVDYLSYDAPPELFNAGDLKYSLAVQRQIIQATNDYYNYPDPNIRLGTLSLLRNIRSTYNGYMHWADDWYRYVEENNLIDAIAFAMMAIDPPAGGAMKFRGFVAAGQEAKVESNILKIVGELKGPIAEIEANEWAIVNEWLEQGCKVEKIAKSTQTGVKTFDWLVDSVSIETKVLEGIDIESQMNTAVKAAKYGLSEQGASKVVIDARKLGLNVEQAQRIIRRIAGLYKNSGGIPGKIEIWTNEGIIFNK